MNTEKLKERRLQAMEILRQQKEVVEQRQRQQLLKQIREQEYESRSIRCCERRVCIFQLIHIHLLLSSSLVYYSINVNDFVVHMQFVKILKQIGQMHRTINKNVMKMKECMYMQPQGVLVHEQCDQYKRCAQCQRNLK